LAITTTTLRTAMGRRKGRIPGAMHIDREPVTSITAQTKSDIGDQ
jgi:hypothetical protein